MYSGEYAVDSPFLEHKKSGSGSQNILKKKLTRSIGKELANTLMVIVQENETQ